jgi:hypothetical protein
VQRKIQVDTSRYLWIYHNGISNVISLLIFFSYSPITIISNASLACLVLGGAFRLADWRQGWLGCQQVGEREWRGFFLHEIAIWAVGAAAGRCSWARQVAMSELAVLCAPTPEGFQ